MKRIILFLVIIVCSACKSTQPYYLPAFIEKNSWAEQDYIIDYERANDSICYVIDSMVGHFYGNKGRTIPYDKETDPRAGGAVHIYLDLDADGVSFFSDSWGLACHICSGVWCMTDSTIHITCNTNREITDTISYLLSAGSYIYGDIDVKVLDKNQLLLKDGTVLHRRETENFWRKARGYK